MTDVLDDQGESLAKELGDAATYVHLDVTSTDDWSAAIAHVEQRHGRLDVLVNNAGIGIPPHTAMDATDEGHRRTLEVNLNGVWNGAPPRIR